MDKKDYQELRSNNGLKFAHSYSNDDTIVLTTAADHQNRKVAIYGLDGKLICLVPWDGCSQFTVTSDKKTLFYLRDGRIESIDIQKPNQAYEPVIDRVADSSGFIYHANDLYVLTTTQWMGHDIKRLQKNAAGRYVESGKTIPNPPGLEKKTEQLGRVWLSGGDYLVMRDISSKGHIYSLSQKRYVEPDLNNFPEFEGHDQVLYCPKRRLLIGNVHNEVAIYSVAQQRTIQTVTVANRHDQDNRVRLERYVMDGNKLIIATDTNLLVCRVPDAKDAGKEPELLALYKYSTKNSSGKVSAVFIHSGQPRKVYIIDDDQVQIVKLFEDRTHLQSIPVDSLAGFKPGQLQESDLKEEAPRSVERRAYGSDYGYEEEEEESDHGAYAGHGHKKTSTKGKKKKPAKKRKKSFELHGMQHVAKPEYNALKDEHLKSYFYSYRIRDHLIKQHLITREGYIIEKPEEYRRDQKLFREHYRSQEMRKGAAKKKKAKAAPKRQEEDTVHERHGSVKKNLEGTRTSQKTESGPQVKKQEFNDFLNTVEQGIQKEKGDNTAPPAKHQGEGSKTDKPQEKPVEKTSGRGEGKEPDEKKPAVVQDATKPKPAEPAKPAEQPRPAETSKPSEGSKPQEKPQEKPKDTKPTETKPAETKPAEAKPVEPSKTSKDAPKDTPKEAVKDTPKEAVKPKEDVKPAVQPKDQPVQQPPTQTPKPTVTPTPAPTQNKPVETAVPKEPVMNQNRDDDF